MSIELSNYDAIAFDVEGTLADNIPYRHEARLRAFDEHSFAKGIAEGLNFFEIL